MLRLFKKSVTMLAVSGLMLSGCGAATQTASDTAAQKSDNKIKVITTFYPMYDFAKNIAGDHADVTALIPSGVEPHDWEPTQKDIEAIAKADVFVYNGGVESWVADTLKSVNNEKLQVVEASQGIALMEGIEEEHDHLDPHVWLDPVFAQKQVRTIEAALEQADPNHKDDYKKNADAFISKLQALDKEYRDTLSSAKRKEFVTQHAAFGYLAKRYGVKQIPIAGLSPDVEPSPSELVEIVHFAKEHQVKTIFFETLVSPKVAETVAKEIGAKTAVLNPIEGLTEEEKANNLDYLGIMKKNLNELAKALNE